MFLNQISKKVKRKYPAFSVPTYGRFLRRKLPPVFFMLSQSGEAAVIRMQKKGEHYLLTNSALLAVPPEFFQKGEIKDRDGIIFFIRELLKNAGIENSPLVMGIIPEERFFQRVIPVEVSAAEDPEILKEKVNEILPLPHTEMIYETKDLKPLAEGELEHRDISIFASGRQYLIDYAKMTGDAKMTLVDFVPESLGIFELARPGIKSEEAVLNVFLDKERALFWILAGEGTHFSAAFPYGTDSFGSQEKLDTVIAEIREGIRFYRDREFHEHGASPVVNRALVFGESSALFDSVLPMNIQLHLERPDAFADVTVSKPELETVLNENRTKFLPLIGAAKLYLK